MKVWILQTGEPLPSDGFGYRPMRASNLAAALVARGHTVVLWSTAFFHQERRHRTEDFEAINLSDRLQVRLIPSPGYTRNIGPGRLYDHALLALRLKRLLRKESALPDVAFIGYPPIEVAAVMSAWLKKNNVPSILDAKDQWPQIFVDPFPGWLQPIARLALFPYFYLGRRAMRDATALASMADSFLGWARGFSGRAPHQFDAVFPLASTTEPVPQSDLDTAQQWWGQKGVADDGRVRVSFVGSLSPAFDFVPVRNAAQEAIAAGKDWQFVICGDGSKAAEVRGLMAGLPNVVMPGWVGRAQMTVLAQRSMAALGPYHNVDNFKNNIPNKVLDAMAMGLPLLTPLEGEVQALVERHAIGIMYGKGRTLYKALALLEADPESRGKMSSSARRVHQEQYGAERVYGNLVSHLESMAVAAGGTTHGVGDQDKLIERARYDAAAKRQMGQLQDMPEQERFGSGSMPRYLRTPYEWYERRIAELMSPQQTVLELGAGSGLHTWALLRTGASVVATDISPNSLALLEQRLGGHAGKIETKVADMEALPLPNSAFDVVACAGCLSYGDPALVNAEILRVLKPGGMLFCVDSLNHNPVYRLNRWIHYLRGQRSLSTLRRMPDMQRIRELSGHFDEVEVRYFGALTFALPVLAKIVGEKRAQDISGWVDRKLAVRRSAFKFVIVAKGLKKVQ